MNQIHMFRQIEMTVVPATAQPDEGIGNVREHFHVHAPNMEKGMGLGS